MRLYWASELPKPDTFMPPGSIEPGGIVVYAGRLWYYHSRLMVCNDTKITGFFGVEIMHLFNASSLFNENAKKEISSIAHDAEKLRNKLIEVKRMLLDTYHFKAYNVPSDFTSASYIIASNHLTDSDAPLIMSYYYEVMHTVTDTYPTLFVFAKENCFNGVSIPQEFMPILEMEKVVEVDRKSFGGSKVAMKSAVKWFAEGKKPKHFLLFSQGTIYDINKDCAEDIEPGAFWLARLLGIPVLPAFIEQAVEGAENRLVFGEPIHIPKDCRNFDEHKQIWLERVIKAQNELQTLTGIPAREAVLDEEHKTRKRYSWKEASPADGTEHKTEQ